jgi:YYY domain-containing protein
LTEGTLLSSPEIQQVLSVASWFFLLTFLQLALYPAFKKTFDRYAYPTAFAGSLLIFTLFSWYCGLARLPVQLALIPFVLLFGWHLYNRRYTAADLREQWQWELVFVLFFFLMLEVRYVNPTISYAEKFMDHAFLASVMRQPVVPPLDPWFAGGVIDVYYYLGYWMFGCFGIVSGVPSNIAFNLALPTVLGISAVTLYAIGDLLIGRLRWLLLATLLLPNPSFFYQILAGKGLSAVIWDSTRTLTNTISEYPLFSFIWGDVHPHVVGIFNQLFLIFVLVYAYRRWGVLSDTARWVICVLAAVSLGSMPAMNTWDVLIYAPIVLLFGILIWRQNRTAISDWSAAQLLFTVPPLAIACYVPFYLRFKASTGGPALVMTPSDPAQFLLVQGFFIGVFCLLLIKDMVKRPYLLLVAVPFAVAGYPAAALAFIPVIFLATRKPADVPQILGILGFILIILTEFVYLKDNMGDTYFRMNTVFKCYNVAWILLSISLFTMAGQVIASQKTLPSFSKDLQAAAAVVIIVMLAALPVVVPLDLNYGNRSLDGLAYLDGMHPGDAAAVAYLRDLPVSADTRIIEAEGGDFNYYSRISSFTGIPTVIGEPFHEVLWRGESGGWYGERTSDVRAIYERPEKTRALMQKYGATYLILGTPEREKYNVTTVSPDVTLVYSDHGTEIYRIL